jgi:co-chaperonin GroES (HSP10)
MFCPFNRLIIKQADAESKTPGGIIIPEKAKGKIAPRRGEVIEAGPECKYVQKGDEVVFDRATVCYDGIPDADGQIVEYVFAKEEDILAVGNRELPTAAGNVVEFNPNLEVPDLNDPRR